MSGAVPGSRLRECSSVGRELRELLAAAAGACEVGRGWTSLIGGEAGIGKTRLAAEPPGST